MRFWLDAHLPPALAPWLGATFKVHCCHIDELGLRDATDTVIFDAARRFQDVVMVTRDHDFVELLLRRGAPPQVLWLNFGNMATIHIQARLSSTFTAALRLLSEGDSLVEID